MKSPANDRKALEQIIRYCTKIEASIRRFGPDFESFVCDSDYVDSVSMNILQIGELAGTLSQEYVDKTRGVMDWRSIKGMRNKTSLPTIMVPWIWNVPGSQRHLMSRS